MFKCYALILIMLLAILMSTNIVKCFADNKRQDVPNELIIFSEHHKAFYAGHEIKLLDINSRQEISLGIQTYSYGDFYIVKKDSIAWIGEGKLYIWNPETRSVDKKILPIQQLPPVFLISLSPSGDKVAYLKPYGKRLYLGGEPKKGQSLNSLGFKSELHIFDLVKNEDVLITDTASDWEAPQWSPDERKILYTRPESDSYFDQSFIDKIEIAKDAPRLDLAKSAIFIYDLDKNINYKLCLGINPSWTPSGNKIAYFKNNRKIGIFNLLNIQEIELQAKEIGNLTPLRLTWSLNEEYIAYLRRPKSKPTPSLLNFIEFIRALKKGYERSMELWVIKINDNTEEFIGTKNFGNIKFAPESYKNLMKD